MGANLANTYGVLQQLFLKNRVILFSGVHALLVNQYSFLHGLGMTTFVTLELQKYSCLNSTLTTHCGMGGVVDQPAPAAHSTTLPGSPSSFPHPLLMTSR